MNYDFAIVIPLYNESWLVSRSLSGICNSINKSKFLLVVVDNGSTDNTSKKVNVWKRNHPNVDLILLREKKQGVLYAKITGMFYAKKVSPVVVSIDIDCKPLEGFEEDILSFCSDDEADVLFGSLRQDQETRFLKHLFLANLMKTIALFEKLEKNLYGPFFFGGFFAIKSEKITRNVFNNVNTPIEAEPSIFWSRRCYYSGLVFKNSKRTIECSSRRFWSDPDFFSSSDRNMVVRSAVPSFFRKKFLVKKIAKNEKKHIENKINIFTYRILMLLLDLILFEKRNQNFLNIPRIIKKVCSYFDLPEKEVRSVKKYNFLKAKRVIYEKYQRKVAQQCKKITFSQIYD
jgi:glycosyltransferase involved in cell wall biosynthesis